jgi:hypothetical protein
LRRVFGIEYSLGMNAWLKANGGPLAIVVVGLSLIGVNQYLGGLVALAGAVLFTATHPMFHRKLRTLPKWDYSPIEAALRDAPPRSHIRILETWLPHVETLAPRLIDKDKDFCLQVLLIDPGSPVASGDLLEARVEHRDDFDRPEAWHNVLEAINVLLKRRKAVEVQSERTVDMKVRLYTFLPFGPLYDIGGRMFVGLYPAHAASEDAPMLIVDPPAKSSNDLSIRGEGVWSLLDHHFKAGWKDAREVSDCDLVSDPPVLQ